MPLIHGACIERKGKFLVVQLVMAREGGKEYKQVYGTYIREAEAVTRCKRINKVGTCSICKNLKQCLFAK